MIPINRTVLMLMTFYLAGSSAAASIASKAHLDSKLGLLAIPVMFLAQLGWKAIAGKTKRRESLAPQPHCLACQSEIKLFRRLSHKRFCSNEHEATYLAELQQIAVARLASARKTGVASDAEISNWIAGNREFVSPARPVDQSLALIVRPKASAFAPAPAYAEQ